jgi:hypothetical protein
MVSERSDQHVDVLEHVAGDAKGNRERPSLDARFQFHGLLTK